MKRAVLLVVVVLALGVAAVYVIGALLPQHHTVTREALLPAAPGRVFGVIADVARYPEWRSSAQRVEVLATDPVRWREHDGGDTITFEMVEREGARRLRVRIADPDLPFGGTWTYDVRAEGEGTRLTITEDGDVYNPIFRFVSRFVIGHTATLDTVLGDLRRHLS